MNKTISRYLDKNILFDTVIQDAPSSDLGMIIVIPCHDEPDISSSIKAIASCDYPDCDVEIIVSINASEDDLPAVKETNLNSVAELGELDSHLPAWIKVNTIVNNELPFKKAGVGLGRKIGMDEAVERFVSLGKEEGVIVCFDADSKCDQNYLTAIISHFDKPEIGSTSIHYEHPIEGEEYSAAIYDSIVQYELHLQYFIRMQKKIQLPYAFHTVGSSMACTVSAYCAVGGMNQKKAGEDFYFIHKLVKYGKHSELNNTRVLPSPRISDRVPFGTGRAIGTMQRAKKSVYFTYHPKSFDDLKALVDGLPEIYKAQKLDLSLSINLCQFLESIKIDKELHRIIQNTSDYPSFYKMFWHWFDAFVLMKYLHYVRDLGQADIPVLDAVNMSYEVQFESAKEALIYFRGIDIIE